jgi:hypothetical protein
VLLAWLLMATLTSVPHLRAHLAPPPGLAFTGFFFWRPDMYNYLTYVQQAEDGAVLFENKLEIHDSRRLLLNPEWWTVGRLSAMLGRRPNLAYQLFGLAGALRLLAGGRSLAAALRPARYAPAPRPRPRLARRRARRAPLRDAGTAGVALAGPDDGLFPFLEMLANPHFMAGTTLLPGGYWPSSARALAGPAGRHRAGDAARPGPAVRRRPARGHTRAGRGVHGAAVALAAPPAPAGGLAPVAVYLFWVFYRSGAFATFFAGYPTPPFVDFVVALGPAALLGAAAWRASRWNPRPAGPRPTWRRGRWPGSCS